MSSPGSHANGSSSSNNNMPSSGAQGEACGPGYRDDDWYLFLNVAPCSLLQSAKEGLNIFSLVLTALALFEVVVSRYKLRIDKMPPFVLFSYVGTHLLFTVSLIYQLAHPYASARRFPDFYVLYVLLVFTISFPVMYAMSLVRYLIRLAGKLLPASLDPDKLASWMKLIRFLSMIGTGTAIGTLFALVVLIIVMPAVNMGDPVRQNVFVTAAFAATALFSFVYVVVMNTLLILTYRIVHKQVRFITMGVEAAASSAPLDLDKARGNASAEALVDLLVRLRFTITQMFIVFSGETIVWTAASIVGRRWYLANIGIILAVVACIHTSISLFRPILLPHFLGGSLGLLMSPRASSRSGGDGGDHCGGGPESSFNGGSSASSRPSSQMSMMMMITRSARTGTAAETKPKSQQTDPDEADTTDQVSHLQRGSVISIDIMRLDLSKGLGAAVDEATFVVDTAPSIEAERS